MARVKRPHLWGEAERRNREQLTRLGGDIRRARGRSRKTQSQVAARASVGRLVVGRIERGLGGATSMDAWQRVALAVDAPLVVSLQRDLRGDTSDAAHLAMQELVIRTGRGGGYRGTFELPTRPVEPWRSADVGLQDDRRRRLVLVECWNTFGDVGASVRSTMRKLAEARELAIARWGDEPALVSGVWVVRASRRNRALVARYPELFASRFSGSSRRWLAALTEGADPPAELGLVWCDLAATRVFDWRHGRGPA